MESGLERYYQLKPAQTQPLLGYFDRRPALDWLRQEPGYAEGSLSLSIEGVQCGACVWAIETLARRHGGARVGLNTALGRLRLRFDPARFNASAYAESLASLGYRLRPAAASNDDDPSRGLLIRLGVCTAVAMNTMSFSLAIYLGLTEDGSGLYTLLRQINLGLTLFALGFGGSYFFGRAWRSLRQGVAHFDIPVALGVLAAFSGSLWAQWRGQGGAVYFDTVNVFLSFMLAGRFLQERALLRQRRQLLQSDALAGLRVTALEPAPREIPFSAVDAGALLFLQPGSLCPANAVLEDTGPAEFDRAAVTGELRPAALRQGEAICAGARLVSSQAMRVRSTAPYAAGILAGLEAAPGGEEELPVLWRWAVRWYVGLVLLAAFGGAAWWLLHDPSVAPRVFISTLVVTCPCGLGIAVPLARTLADRRLQALGLTVRQPGLLERVLKVEQVHLDKTGTLSFSHLELADPAALDALAPEAQRALLAASASSKHPVSRSLFRELSARGVAWPGDGAAEEVPGEGVHWRAADGHWFLGRSMAEGAEGLPARAELRHDGRLIAQLDLRERLLEDAPASLASLRAQGLGVELLSGDHPARVRALAAQLGLPAAAARGGLNPAQKRDAIGGERSLMLGDGLNDAQALRAAGVSGTPAWERSVVADQADFSFSSASLAWLPELFATAKALRRAVWGNLLFAAVYNAGLLCLTLQGKFSPLLCAVTMPGSSLLVILLTARALRAR
jgi:Cu2+-exporting ATPase